MSLVGSSIVLDSVSSSGYMCYLFTDAGANSPTSRYS